MNRQEFQYMMSDDFGTIVSLNTTKGHDYAGDDDALLNFKRQAETLGLTPEQIWAVYATKHWDAVMTYCREGDVASEPIEGRLHDVILYCFLLLGLMREKQMLNAPAEIFDVVGGGVATSFSAPAEERNPTLLPWQVRP